MPAINTNLSRFSHSLMVTVLALTVGLSANVNGRGLNPNLIRRRQHVTNSDDGPALDRRLHERGTNIRQNNKAARSYYNPQQMDRLTLLLAFLTRDNHRNVAGSIRGKRAQCTTTMDALVSSYVSFYDTLSPFLNAYPSHLLPAYQSSALTEVTAILDLLPKDSSYITSGNVNEVKDGINKTLEMTEYMLQRGARFLRDSSQDWFRSQQSLLTLRMGMVYLSIGCVVNEGDSQTVQEEASGIGGGNTSKKGGPSASTLAKDTLKNFPCGFRGPQLRDRIGPMPDLLMPIVRGD